MNMIVPIMLKSTWARAVLFALLDDSRADKTDVIQVPILKPNTMYIEDFSGMTPWLATACKIPRDVDDEMMIG